MKPREFLALRENWQAEANQRGGASESGFESVMREVLRLGAFGHYRVSPKPRDLAGLYGAGEQWGIVPDFAVRNDKTERVAFVEIKRQNDRGNAHERACKYFAPGIVAAGRRCGNIRPQDFPFFLIFTNGLTTNERYSSEIEFWFSSPDNPKMRKHLLLWNFDKVDLLDFFQDNIRPVID